MAKRRLSDKAQRLLTFLMAMRFPAVRRAALQAGYGEAQIREGWRLLMLASGSRLDMPPPSAGPKDAGHLAALDGWENQFYPVAEATLEFNFPELHASVFNGLSQTTGPPLVVTVSTLLDRIAMLPPEAKALLAERNLTEARLQEARDLIAKVQEAQAAAPPDDAELAARQASLDEAETAMWRHYLEWSKILRAQITRVRYLQLMGFGTGKRSSAGVTTVPTEPPTGDDEADLGDDDVDLDTDVSTDDLD